MSACDGLAARCALTAARLLKRVRAVLGYIHAPVAFACAYTYIFGRVMMLPVLGGSFLSHQRLLWLDSSF